MCDENKLTTLSSKRFELANERAPKKISSSGATVSAKNTWAEPRRRQHNTKMWSLSVNDGYKKAIAQLFLLKHFFLFVFGFQIKKEKKCFLLLLFISIIIFSSRVRFASAKTWRRRNAICTSQKLICYVYYVLSSEQAIREQKPKRNNETKKSLKAKRKLTN